MSLSSSTASNVAAYYSVLFFNDTAEPICIYRLPEAEVFDEAIDMASDMMNEDETLCDFDILISHDMPVAV